MMRPLVALSALVLTVCSCAGPPASTAPGPAGIIEGPWRQQTHMIPLTAPDGTATLLLGRVCRPASEAPARVVVIAHGSPPVASERPRMQLATCDSEAARWFLSRGHVVVFSMRRGYGGTGGGWVEGAGGCMIDDYIRSARVSAQDLDATLAYALALSYARPDGAILVGQSAGGWAAVGLNAAPHPNVAAIVSMAGGRGGHADNVPHRNCHAENMAAAAGVLGRTATTPMLWVYTANDSYFAPPIAAAMHQAFIAAGGRADLQAVPSFGEDGHRLFLGRGGSLVWGPLVERYLAQQSAL